MINMGLQIQVDPKEGHVQQKSLDLRVGSKGEEMQILRNGNFPSSIERGEKGHLKGGKQDLGSREEVGVQCEGGEEEVIDEIRRLEGQ
ncbi:hypothetical protein PVK06_024922 [Gossypium arboreum]|uniref:Uncharacterized protein n=1 Tax=Gossypium arboreum TaxID=29729 RepID=A0ABR0PFE7_GOSAR|nr:hypothetical protein PVK06_024922 [Gossypium arboreum]